MTRKLKPKSMRSRRNALERFKNRITPMKLPKAYLNLEEKKKVERKSVIERHGKRMELLQLGEREGEKLLR